MPKESKTSLTTCSRCQTTTSTTWTYRDGNWLCKSCAGPSSINLESFDPTNPKSFMKNDRKWRKDISNRKLLPDGTVGRFRKTKGGGLERYG